jgi:hypothetical protein
MGDPYLFGVLDMEGRVKLGASKGILLHVASRIQTCLGFGKAFSTQEVINKHYRYKKLDYQVKESFVARRISKNRTPSEYSEILESLQLRTSR